MLFCLGIHRKPKSVLPSAGTNIKIKTGRDRDVVNK